MISRKMLGKHHFIIGPFYRAGAQVTWAQVYIILIKSSKIYSCLLCEQYKFVSSTESSATLKALKENDGWTNTIGWRQAVHTLIFRLVTTCAELSRQKSFSGPYSEISSLFCFPNYPQLYAFSLYNLQYTTYNPCHQHGDQGPNLAASSSLSGSPASRRLRLCSSPRLAEPGPGTFNNQLCLLLLSESGL